MYQETASKLAQRACPSIAYRIRKEILREDISSPGMMALQEEILREPEIVRLFALQKEDGWLGGLFHGTDEPESAIRYLAEKGVEPSHPAIQRALHAIILRGDAFDKGCMERVGKPLDEKHLGGSKLIKACVFAYACDEKHDFVREAVSEALHVFRYVCSVTRMEDVCEPYKEKLVFRPYVLWPSIYHLRLLAHTHLWRTEANKQMLAMAVKRLAELSPIPEIKVLHKHQVISPASVYMNSFNDDMTALGGREWMMWFHRTELIARLGIAPKLDYAVRQLNVVHKLLAQSSGFFTQKLRHYYFTKWTQYIGLALETDWRTEEKRINDLTFRCLLIQSYQEG